MENIQTLLLALGAFLLGAVPFSLLIGWWALGVDIRDFGDGNPGAYNVFRAGGQKSGVLAIFLDVAKGVPLVLLAHAAFGLSGTRLVIIALAPVLGHAFSPFLRWQGGKSVAVTFGVLAALPQYDLLLAFTAVTFLAFLFIEVDSWVVIFGGAGAMAYSALTFGGSWETLLMFCLLVVLAVKHFDSLRVSPGFHGRLIRWLQALFRSTFTII